VIVGLAIALMAVACGDDGGSDPAPAEGDTEVSAEAGGDTEAVDVVVPQVDPALAGVYL
jgi:hypothetical protein